jgi:hypothetical protein
MPLREAAMQCPVCLEKAENLTPNTLQGVVVGCKQCGDYRISAVAFAGFMRLEADQKRAALAAARSSATHGWPMIGSVPAGLR